ncbi:MAG: preprotein translocase subunit SecE [Actinobacteria bacterium]|nr:preprotein translocase subunit SecE [Actinomycetota bacterium]
MSEAEFGEHRESRKNKDGGSRNPFTRASIFVQESIAELRRVVWPTQKQVVTYTVIVLVFVTVMSLLVSAIDILVGRGILRIFGS